MSVTKIMHTTGRNVFPKACLRARSLVLGGQGITAIRLLPRKTIAIRWTTTTFGQGSCRVHYHHHHHHYHHRHGCTSRSITTTRPQSLAGTNANDQMNPTDKDDDPLLVIQSATTTVQTASRKLRTLYDKIQQTPVLVGAREFPLLDIVVHARDATVEDFDHPTAVRARQLAVPLARTVRDELQALSTYFVTRVQPQLAQASHICESMPCGGATLVLQQQQQKNSNNANTSDSHIRTTSRKDTPCGQLATATLDFWQTSHDTAEAMILASRAALILELAHEQYGAPLQSIRRTHQRELAQAFRDRVVPTPWVRSKEEYEAFFQIQKDMQQT